MNVMEPRRAQVSIGCVLVCLPQALLCVRAVCFRDQPPLDRIGGEDRRQPSLANLLDPLTRLSRTLVRGGSTCARFVCTLSRRLPELLRRQRRHHIPLSAR